MQLLSVKETAKRFHLSERRVQILCENKRIDGAQMISGVWLIPSTAQKPTDERATPTDEKYFSLAQLCKELSISAATGRNWIKLGKLVPSSKIKNSPIFSKSYVEQLKADIKSGKNSALKNRRNKKYISGTTIYHSYVTDQSVNLPIVQSVVNHIEAHHIEITEELLRIVLAECAIQLLVNKQNGRYSPNCLSDYLNGQIKKNHLTFLIDDILDDVSCVQKIIDRYPELFGFTYTYESNEDILGLLYISLNHSGIRKVTGSYYTPTKVVQKLCQQLFAMNEAEGKTLLDPCCGTGNFILQLPYCINPDLIYGNDIDSLSIQIARINYALKYDIFDAATLYTHFTVKDYLSFGADQKYDFIIGNPPWGYVFSEEQKKQLKKKFRSASGSNIESYDVFIEQALANLCPSGMLSFVLPDAVLNVKNHNAIREIMLHCCTFEYIEFLGNVFDKVQCPCMILQTKYTQKKFDGIGLTVNDGTRVFQIQKARYLSSECFSFNMTDKEYHIVEKLTHLDNSTTLLGKSKFALGIVTGNNQDYISKDKTAENEIVLRGSDLYKFRFAPSDHYIVFQPESFQQVAPTEYYRAKEKLLYRFICNQLVFAYDNNQTLSLNSCNILIPDVTGLNMKYIMAVLNSRPAQFFFKKKFQSLKVLRSHIEQIPVPTASPEIQNDIITIVDSLLDCSENSIVQTLYDQIDGKVATLYELNDDEYQIIGSSMEGENLFLFHS